MNEESFNSINHYDILLKLVLVGDAGVGKTSSLMQKTENKFSEQCKATVGVDFKIEKVKFKDKTIKIQYWDTAGSERYRSITSSYFRGCSGILLMFDVTLEQSFLHVENWVVDIRKIVENVPILLVGNKSDRVDFRKVRHEDCLKLAKKLELNYMEMSAKENIGVKEAFDKLIELSVEGNNYLMVSGKMMSQNIVCSPASLSLGNENANDKKDKRKKNLNNKCCK
ncbi:hypothetical protein ABK040_016870 [Willaertia magna]